VLDHQHGQRAECEAEPEHVADEIGLPDDVVLDERLAEGELHDADDGREHDAAGGEHHRPRAQPAEFGRGARGEDLFVQRG
jgi:hypothetical protein